MKLSRCGNGHFYNKDKHEVCPHCVKTSEFQNVKNEEAPWNPIKNPIVIPAGGIIPPSEKMLLLPRELSDCTLMDKIGSGGVGDVYRIQRKIDYAVKIVEWKYNNSQILARKEYETAKLFSGCKNIIEYIGYYEDTDRSFITQELGVSWLDHCRSAPVNVGYVMDTILSICDALEAIHLKGYQHYDINPKNIFICGDIIKIGDFSHSSNIEKRENYKHRTGTFQFMAPEIIDGGMCSGTEDIYSLGVTMYMLFTGGRLPYDFKGRIPAARQKQDKLISIFLNSDFLSIIERATAYDPADRYQKVTDLRNDIIALKEKYMDSLSYIIPWIPSKYGESVSLEGEAWIQNSHNMFVGMQLTMDDDLIGDYCSTVLMDDSDNIRLSYAEQGRKDDHNKLNIEQHTEQKPVKVDEVQFTAVTEKAADRDDYSIIEVAMYTGQFKEEVIDELRKEFSKETKEITSNLLLVKEYSNVTVEISADGIEINVNNLL